MGEDDEPEVVRTGDASNAAVSFVIAKTFFGLAFLITPKGFQESGIIAGPLFLVIVYLMELRSMLSLIRCRLILGPNTRYEDLGAVIHPAFPSVVTLMIILCQVGFCCVWLVSIAENLGTVMPDLTHTQRLWIQIPILMALVWVRKLKYFALTNLIGIGLAVVMAAYFFYFMSDHLSNFGPETVQLVNTENNDWILWLGSCAYTYEGINIVLPAFESAKDKDAMPKLLVSITALITLLYIAFGCLTYLAFGTEVQSMATLNLPRGSPEGRAVPCMSILIGLVSFPLQAFVVFQTYEVKLRWSDTYLVRKWQKNAMRSLVLLLIVTLTWMGGDKLQNFLGLVGGVCCASLGLIFPSVLNVLICKPGPVGLCMDAVIVISGVCILVMSTVQAFVSWK